MGPEVWVGLAAVFVSGGAVGASGVLLSQWLVRKLGSDDRGSAAPTLEQRELGMLRTEVAEMALKLQNLDERLDFQEQLLDGATPLGSPPPRLAPSEPSGPGPGAG